MRTLLLAASALAWAGAARAEPVTFADALARASTSAPSLQARGLQVAAAQSALRAADQLPDPKLSVGITDFPLSGPLAGHPERDNFSMVTLGYSQDVPNRAKRRARADQALAGISVAEAEALAERRSVRIATALAWVDLFYARKKLEALELLASALASESTTAPSRLTSGASRPAEALAPEQAKAALADRRESLRAALGKARAELGRWIGFDPGVEPQGAPPSPALDAEALRANLDRLPQLAAKSAMIRRAAADRGAAKAETRSDWGYEVEYAHRDPRFGDYVSAKLNFSLPLFRANRQDPIIAARTSDVARATAEREATRRELQAALEGDLAEHAMHHAQLARARETLVPLARERLDLETASYAARTASLSDVLTVQRAFVDARLDVLDREAETVRDGVRLALTYGEEPQ